MKGEVDPHLLAQIAEAGDDGQVEAVILLANTAKGSAAQDRKEAGPQLIDQVASEVHERPAEVRHMPNLGTMYVRGSGKFVRQLLESDEVSVATANDAEITTAGT